MARSFLLPLALLAVLAAGPVGCGPDGPTLVVTPASHDFGRVPLGETRRATFTLSNRGDRFVSFSVNPSCPCFSVSKSLRPLDPGQSQTFEVVLATANLTPQRIRGKYIAIRTDHPGQAEVILPLTGEVYGVFDLKPGTLHLGTIPDAEHFAPRIVTIRPMGGRSLALKGYRGIPDVFDVAAEPWQEGGLKLTLTLREGAHGRGPFAGRVVFDLSVTGPDGEVRARAASVDLRGVWGTADGG